MPGDIFTLLMQGDAPWWTLLVAVLVGGAVGAVSSWRAASAQRRFDLARGRDDQARAVTIDEISRTREICVALFNDLQGYSRQAMLLRADATLGRQSNVEVALALTEAQSAVMETYATARLYAPGPVSEATARIVKIVMACPILDSQEEFDSWSGECKRMGTFLLQVGENRIKELSGKPVPKNWYEHLIITFPTRAEQQGPKRVVPHGRQRAKAKAS